MFNSCTEWQQRSHVDETVEVTELNRQGSCLPVIPINSCTDWQQQSCIDETVEVTEQNRQWNNLAVIPVSHFCELTVYDTPLGRFIVHVRVSVINRVLRAQSNSVTSVMLSCDSSDSDVTILMVATWHSIHVKMF